MESTRKPCVFCGDTLSKLTREHAFGNWMATAFKDCIDEYGAVEIRTGTKAPIRCRTGPFTDTVRIACKSCNEGWMNDCELGVQQMLAPMMTGGFPRLLTEAHQTALATWAVKTPLVLDHHTPRNPIVPNMEYSELFATKRPLPSHIVWVGHTDPRRSNLVINSTNRSLRPDLNWTTCARILDISTPRSSRMRTAAPSLCRTRPSSMCLVPM